MTKAIEINYIIDTDKRQCYGKDSIVNELNTTNHDLDHSQDVASIDLERLLVSSLPRTKLLPLVTERVKLAITQFVQTAPILTSSDEAVASTKVVDYLRSAQAIPLEPELCILMARVGFDKALFTYGHADGIPVGYAEGSWLLEFVEPKESGPATDQQASWLEFPGKNATRH